MSLFVSLGTGPKLFIEVVRWADGPRGMDVRRENGELLIWLGRLHVIYTPAKWRPQPRGPTHGGPTTGGPPIGPALDRQNAGGQSPGRKLAA